MRISVFVVAAAMLLSAPAFAQVETPPPPESTSGGATAPEAPPANQDPASVTEGALSAAAPTEAAAEPELVCRNITARTESRLRSARTRVCKTQAEWDAQAAAGNRSN